MATHRFGGRGNLFSKRGKSISNLLRRGRGNYKLSRFLTSKQKKFFLNRMKPHMKGRGVTVRSKGAHHASELEKELGRMKSDTKDPITKREAIILGREIEREQAAREQLVKQEQQVQRHAQQELLDHIRQQGSSVGFEPTTEDTRVGISNIRATNTQPDAPVGRVPFRGASTIASFVQPAVAAPPRGRVELARDQSVVATPQVHQRRQPTAVRVESIEETDTTPTPAQAALPAGRRVVVEVGENGVQTETDAAPLAQADSTASRGDQSPAGAVDLPPVLT